jgi:hypothetical protein
VSLYDVIVADACLSNGFVPLCPLRIWVGNRVACGLALAVHCLASQKINQTDWLCSSISPLTAGDSYIFLHTKKKNSALDRDIFFWLGKDSSQDERGACAYKTVELDTFHDDEPTQHREVQGHETPEFLDLFKAVGGLQYADGGVDSGFTKVDRDAYPTRLLHIKGRRHILTAEVKVDPGSMNSGDVFVLDTKHDIYQWNGKDCSKLEKQHAMEVTRKIRDEDHNKECRAKISIIDEGVDSDAEFWEKMGCSKPAQVAAATDDAAHEKAQAANIKL